MHLGHPGHQRKAKRTPRHQEDLMSTHTSPLHYRATLSIAVLLAVAAILLALGDEHADAAGSPVVIEANFNGTLSSHPSEHHKARNTADAATGKPADWAADYQ